MSERLEEIAYNVGVSLDGEKAIMSSDDYDFLYSYALQQAERVQELEQDVREWEIVNEQWEKINTQIAEQNKRYREALEKISAPIDKVTYAYMFAVKQIARQVKHWRVKNEEI